MPKTDEREKEIGAAVLAVILEVIQEKGRTMEGVSAALNPRNSRLIRKMKLSNAVPMVSTLFLLCDELGVKPHAVVKRAERMLR